MIAENLAILATVICLTVPVLTQPRIGDVQYRQNEGAWMHGELPLRINSPAAPTVIDARMTVQVGTLFFRLYRVVIDDCLTSLVIDNTPLDTLTHKLCDDAHNHTLDLSRQLTTGTHIVEARITNGGGNASFSLMPSGYDRLFVLPVITWLILMTLAGSLWIHAQPEKKREWGIAGIVLLGVVLRLFYVAITPESLRGYDTDGHIEYIRYITQHSALPAPNAGWEFWQPPLYYVLGSLVMKMGEMIGWAAAQSIVGLQMLSLAFSIAVLLICAWIATMLFPREGEGWARTLLTGILATLPSIVFFSARINNDVLVALLSFLWLGLLLRWWLKQYGWLEWVLLSVAIGLHLLTKNTGLLLLPVSMIVLVCAKQVTKKRRIAMGAALICICVFIAGWLPLTRPTHFDVQHVIGNAQNLNSQLQVRNDLTAYLTFNPIQILRNPYNNPWNEESRRHNFWEYLFRSAYVGEFEFGEWRKMFVSTVLLLGLLSLPVIALGIVTAVSRRWPPTLPLLATLFILLLGHAALRWQYPFSSTQDFRYSTLVVLPLAAFALRGIYAVAWLRKPLSFLLWASVFSSMIFLLSLYRA